MLAVLVSSNYAEFARFQHQNTWLAYVNIAITIGTAIALSIVSTNSGVAGLSRTTPINYILLAIFTLAESYLVSFICTLYETESVLMCGALTVAVTAGLTVHALTTKKDYRSNFGTLPGIVWIVLTVGLLNMLFRIDFISTLLSIVFAIIYMIYIVVDTQLIMGGEKG
jgi:FtsH-binding integral membrane protein